MNTLQITTTKHRNCLIQNTPSEQFPDLVTVVKTPKVKEIFNTRRYLSLQHAIIAIDLWEGEQLIGKGAKSAKKDMIELGITEDEILDSTLEE
jgi:hypothetical protein